MTSAGLVLSSSSSSSGSSSTRAAASGGVLVLEGVGVGVVGRDGVGVGRGCGRGCGWGCGCGRGGGLGAGGVGGVGGGLGAGGVGGAGGLLTVITLEPDVALAPFTVPEGVIVVRPDFSARNVTVKASRLLPTGPDPNTPVLW